MLSLSLFIDKITRENKWIVKKDDYLDQSWFSSEEETKNVEIAKVVQERYGKNKIPYIVYANDLYSLLNSMKIWAYMNDLFLYTDLTMDMVPIVWAGEGYYCVVKDNGKYAIVPCAMVNRIRIPEKKSPIQELRPLEIYKQLVAEEPSVALNLVNAKTEEELKEEFGKLYKNFEIVFEGPGVYDLYYDPIQKKKYVMQYTTILKRLFETHFMYFYRILNREGDNDDNK